MIKVYLQPEPERFDELVRQPGLKAIAEDKEELPSCWREMLPQLWDAYDGICAYVGIYIHPVTGGRSTEHFVAKSKDRDKAYEWSNYRLACRLMNARKRDFTDVLDPFEIETGWFILEFVFMQVLPNPDVSSDIQQRVQKTIDRLKLNDEDCLAARRKDYDDFLKGDISFAFLKKHSPFVAIEHSRQKHP
jgi:hypothetical protein